MSCPSIETYANGYLLSRARIGWYFDQYFQHGEDRQSKSALFASSDELVHQPPALIINAAVDPLYDEGVAYAAKLSEAGVDTQHMTRSFTLTLIWKTSMLISASKLIKR